MTTGSRDGLMCEYNNNSNNNWYGNWKSPTPGCTLRSRPRAGLPRVSSSSIRCRVMLTASCALVQRFLATPEEAAAPWKRGFKVRNRIAYRWAGNVNSKVEPKPVQQPSNRDGIHKQEGHHPSPAKQFTVLLCW